MTLTRESVCTLNPQVALRPEPFGALAYHYGNRRLVFLKHPDMVKVVKTLADHANVGAALDACGITASRQPTFLAALDQLNQLYPQGDLPAGIAVVSGGTDGEDGPTDAAGALLDHAIVASVRLQQLDPADALSRNDAYHFFQPLGALIQTGPTHTNVCDLRVVLYAGTSPSSREQKR